MVCIGLQVARDELLDEEEYSDIVDDISEEIEAKYGHITAIAIPRPATPDDRVSTTLHLLLLLPLLLSPTTLTMTPVAVLNT